MKQPSLVTITQPARELTSKFHGAQKQEAVSSLIDRFPNQSFALLTLLFAVAVAALSSFKLLWFDELITLHIARLGEPAAVWKALAQAADPNPPLTHLAVLVCRHFFGEQEWALRLPAAVGYWLGMFSLFLFLRRRFSGAWAIAGTLLSMTNAGFDFSFESRSYGIFYGLTMLAILCWSKAVDPRLPQHFRVATLGGMVMALALAISTNYFAVLAFLPIAGGEFIRSWQKRKDTDGRCNIAWRIWIGLALALTPMLAYRPLIERSVAQFAPHAFNKVSLGQVPGSYWEMVEYILYPVCALFTLATAVRMLARSAGRPAGPMWLAELVARQARFRRSSLPIHESAAALVLVAYPLFGYALAKLYGGMFSARFILPVCLGFAIAGTAVAFRLFGHLPYASIGMLVFLLAWFIARESYVGYVYKEQKQSFYRVVNVFPATCAAGPIVISDPLMALPFQHYAPRALGSRVVYPIDFDAVRSLRGDDSPEENLWASRSTVADLTLVPLVDLQRNSTEYLILAADGNWLVEALRSHGYAIRRLPVRTHADGIGGFTPLAHGMPAFFVAAGDQSLQTKLAAARPKPFGYPSSISTPK